MVNIQSVTIIGKELAQHVLQMAEVIAGSKENLRERPLFSSLVCTIAPLEQDKHGIEGASNSQYGKSGGKTLCKPGGKC